MVRPRRHADLGVMDDAANAHNPVSFRTLILMLLLLVAVLIRPGSALATGEGRQYAVEPAVAIKEARRALRAGDSRDAVELFRIAWTDPEHRRAAAHALNDLELSGRFSPITDEQKVRVLLDKLGRGFARYETQHFVILSDLPAQRVRAIGTDMERTRSRLMQLGRRLALSPIPHPERLVAIVFEQHGAYADFASRVDKVDPGWIAGYYTLGANRIVLYDDLTGPAYTRAVLDVDRKHEPFKQDQVRVIGEGPDPAVAAEAARRAAYLRDNLRTRAETYFVAKAVHETVHLLAFNTGVQRPDRVYPLWLSEGLALSFETERTDRQFGPAFPFHEREDALRAAAASDILVPWDRVVSLLAPPSDQDEIDRFYAQSYALFSHLAERRPEQLGAYFRSIEVLRWGVRSEEQALALFTAHFGRPNDVASGFVAGKSTTRTASGGRGERRNDRRNVGPSHNDALAGRSAPEPLSSGGSR